MANEMYTQGEADLSGYSLRESRARAPQVAAAAALWADLINGRVPTYLLQESLQPRTPAACRAIDTNYPGIFSFREGMTRSDFPLLTGDVLDRMALARYREFPAGWRRFMKVNNNLRDFRTVRRIAANGLEGQWNRQDEQQEVDYAALSETEIGRASCRERVLRLV